jgi:CubicO group peptidase (beta-lactamase class C family)
MYRHLALLFLIFIFTISCSDSGTETDDKDTVRFPAQGTYEGEYWPTEGWRSCKPSEVGMDSAKLMLAYQYASDPNLNTDALVIIKNGYVVGEAYLNGTGETSLLDAYSVTKSFTSALVGIAIDEGVISRINEYAYQYLPAWSLEGIPAIKKRVKLRHLITMTGGLDWNRDTTATDDYVMLLTNNYIEYVLTKNVIVEPGTEWYYSNGEAMLWSEILSYNLDRSVDIYSYQKLQKKIGVPTIFWSSDFSGNTNTAYGMKGIAKDFAKFGYLYLKKGIWDGERIISESWIKESTSAASEEINFYGYYWWLPPGFESYPNYSNIPDSTFMALGANAQRLYIVPEKDLVIVRMGHGNDSGEYAWDTMKFLSIVVDAINE